MCCPLSAFRAQESSGVPTFLPPFDLPPQIIGRGVLMRAFFVACTKSSLVLIVLSVVCLPAAAHAQQANHSYTAQRPLITEAIDESRLTILKGNTHPLARPEFDLGTADSTLPLKRMLLVLKRSDEQESACANCSMTSKIRTPPTTTSGSLQKNSESNSDPPTRTSRRSRPGCNRTASRSELQKAAHPSNSQAQPLKCKKLFTSQSMRTSSLAKSIGPTRKTRRSGCTGSRSHRHCLLE